MVGVALRDDELSRDEKQRLAGLWALASGALDDPLEEVLVLHRDERQSATGCVRREIVRKDLLRVRAQGLGHEHKDAGQVVVQARRHACTVVRRGTVERSLRDLAKGSRTCNQNFG